ncbi:MAG: hypothetical protein HY304_09025 [candidate division Zixibacteria bacterium]|nr:hypothetical protein [candidate division Zixibacteria bacterium]
MTEQKRQRIFIGIFIAALAFGLYMKPWERRQPGMNATADVAGGLSPVLAAAGTAANSSTSAATPVAFASEWPSSPFEKPDRHVATGSTAIVTAAAPEASRWQLQGIMTVGGVRVCVVNGQTLKVGGAIDGWRLDRITDNAVWLLRGAETTRLSM